MYQRITVLTASSVGLDRVNVQDNRAAGAGLGADGVVVDSFDVARNESVRTRAAAAILAMPHFVAARIAPGVTAPAKAFGYAPWLIANVTVDRHPAGRGAKLAWDNVSATSEALGYVVATHQTIGAHAKETVLT